MALLPKLANAQASRAADAVTVRLNNGWIRIYTTPRPADADTAASGTILAELRYNATAFGAAVNGVATANAISEDTSANATGTAAWFRAFESDGTTAVFDGEVGTSGADMNLNSVAISVGAAVQISAHTYTQSKV